MNESRTKQKFFEANAFKGIKQYLADAGVPCSDLRIGDALTAYACDYGITGDELKGLNRRFLIYLTEQPEQAIRRYITESVTLTEPFDERMVIKRIRMMLQVRGADRMPESIRMGVDHMAIRQGIKTKAEAYAAYEAMFAPVNVDAGWSRLTFAAWIESQLTR